MANQHPIEPNEKFMYYYRESFQSSRDLKKLIENTEPWKTCFVAYIDTANTQVAVDPSIETIPTITSSSKNRAPLCAKDAHDFIHKWSGHVVPSGPPLRTAAPPPYQTAVGAARPDRLVTILDKEDLILRELARHRSLIEQILNTVTATGSQRLDAGERPLDALAGTSLYTSGRIRGDPDAKTAANYSTSDLNEEYDEDDDDFRADVPGGRSQGSNSKARSSNEQDPDYDDDQENEGGILEPDPLIQEQINANKNGSRSKKLDPKKSEQEHKNFRARCRNEAAREQKQGRS